MLIFSPFSGNAFNRFQLLGRHIGQRLDRVTPALQFLDQAFARPVTFSSGVRSA